MASLTKALRRASFASVPLKSTKASKVCTNRKNSQKDKRLVMWFKNYQHSNVGIHNTRRCVMHFSLNGTKARRRQNLSIFSVKSLNSSKIYVFLTVYHWDKQVINFFLNYRHLLQFRVIRNHLTQNA